MRFQKVSFAIIWILIILMSFSFVHVYAEEKLDSSNNRYYLGESVKTGWDKGYVGEEKIKEGDVHFGWEIGSFYVDGFTSVVKDSNDTPVFLKNVGDKVCLWFKLNQDIEKLNNDENLKIANDSNGYDEYFSIPKTDFQRGALIIRKTDYTNKKADPVIYTDYLAANASTDADTKVELCEEGDYEVALDYEIKNTPRKVANIEIIPEYSNYRIFFKFSVRNGNCMVYPFDIKTKGELSNSSVTENGFYLDFANSRYLDINIKKEVLNETSSGLSEDVRFNRPAKDGEQYTEEGIYTITATNRYTGKITTKKLYVGSDEVLKAVAATGLTVKEVKNYISKGAKIKADGTLELTEYETVVDDETSDKQEETTADSSLGKLFFDNLIWFIIGGAVLLFLIVLFIIIKARKRKKRKKIEKYVDINDLTDDQEVD